MIKTEFETFMEISNFQKNNLEQKKPSCFNGILRIKKYKVTIEEIPESEETLKIRLQELWDTMQRNHHHYRPMMSMAKKLNFELVGEMGAKNKKQGDMV